MLEPNNQESLVDLLRPPAGFRVDSAIGTTYGLDFIALTAALLGFVDAEAENRAVLRRPVEILRILSRLSRKVRIFVNRGYIQLASDEQLGKLFSPYDRMLQEVRLDEGSFHPKVWLIRFIPMDPDCGDPPLTRFLCGSRNMTASNNWEVVACLEGEETRRTDSKIGVSLAAFCRKLCTGRPEKPFRRLIDGLPRVDFRTSREMGERLDFLWQWADSKGLRVHLPRMGRKVIVVSPFVRKTFLEDLLKKFDRMTLVSTQMALDRLPSDFVKHLEEKHEIFVVESVDGEDGTAIRDLHAKLLICEGAGSSVTFLGSANASYSGWWGRNCEGVVAFSPGVGLSKFRQNFLEHGWVTKYERQELEEGELEIAGEDLDRFQEAFAGSSLRAAYSTSEKSLTIECRDCDEQFSGILSGETGLDVAIAPLSLSGDQSQWRPARDLCSNGAIFSPVDIGDLGEFVAIKARHSATGRHKVFVVKAEVDFAHLFDDRMTQVLNQYLDKDAFSNLLWSIIQDDFDRPGGEGGGGDGRDGGDAGEKGHLLGAKSFEDVILSCTNDPSRIQEVEDLLAAFKDSDHVDPKFMRFWKDFSAAFHRVEAER